MTEKERYKPVGTWAEVFQKEGARINAETIRRRLKEAGIIGRDARDKTGRILMGGFFPESIVRQVCKDLLNRLNAEYFSDSSNILADLNSFAQALSQETGQPQTPLDLSTSNLASLSAPCHNGEIVKGQTYLRNAAVVLGLAKNTTEASSSCAESLALLLKTACIEVRDEEYYRNPEIVRHDLNSFAQAFSQKTGKPQTPLDLSTSNLAFLSAPCHNGETVRGPTYLLNAAVALGLAENTKEASSRLAETLALLFKIAGIEVRDEEYYRNPEIVRHDLNSFAQAFSQKTGKPQTPLDLNTKNLESLSAPCHNGETVKGQTYLNNAVVALGFAKNAMDARSRLAETLKQLKKIAGLKG